MNLKTQKKLKIAGIAVMLLGSIHLIATPVIFPFNGANGNLDLASVYMFVVVGISTVLTGWLQHYTMSRFNDDSGYKRILLVTIVFLCIMGIGAIAAMWNNPFAYISFLIAGYEVILFKQLVKIHPRLNEQSH